MESEQTRDLRHSDPSDIPIFHHLMTLSERLDALEAARAGEKQERAKLCYPFGTGTCADPLCKCRDEKRAAKEQAEVSPPQPEPFDPKVWAERMFVRPYLFGSIDGSCRHGIRRADGEPFRDGELDRLVGYVASALTAAREPLVREVEQVKKERDSQYEYNAEAIVKIAAMERDVERLKAERDRFKEIGQQFERDSRQHFDQGCQNLKRAEAAEARVKELEAKPGTIHEYDGAYQCGTCGSGARLVDCAGVGVVESVLRNDGSGNMSMTTRKSRRQKFHSAEAWGRWVCAVMACSGGSIQVNEYRYIRSRDVMIGLGHAKRLGWCKRLRGRPDRAIYTITDEGRRAAREHANPKDIGAAT